MHAPHHTTRVVLSTLLLTALGALAACGAEPAAANGSTPAGGNAPQQQSNPNRQGGGGPFGNFGGGGGGPNAVEIAVVEVAGIARTSVVVGQLAPLRSVVVTSQTPGALTRVLVEEGTAVREGQLLAELDGRELRAQLRAAEASRDFAKATSERSTRMFEQKIVTAQEYERDRAALASAEASLAQLETRVGFTRITAPITGVVMQRLVQTGDIVGGQTRLFTISDVGTLVTQLPVSELEVPRLEVGAQVPVRVDALGRDVTGTIRRIFPAADSVSRLVPVEVAVPGGSVSGLRPGYTVRVTLKLDERQGALVIPSRAVMGAAGAQYVFVLHGDRAERRRVRIGNDMDGRTEVVEGLLVGDTIVTTGNALLRDGATVRVVQPLSPEAPTVPRTVPPAGGNSPTTPSPGTRP
jgi:RND family efflux transporter MFP subunit